jgi:threonine-phosphate decarboxylase
VTRTTAIPAPGDHGGDAVRLADALGFDSATMIDLSASLNPFAPDIHAVAIAELSIATAGSLTRYPDHERATTAMAAAMDVDPDLLVLTNGGAEAITLVAAELPVGNVIEPDFSLYRRHLTRIDESAPRWRSNPSSPLGELARADDEAGVWDEAFYALATGKWTRGDAASWRLGSLTKLWSCPGLRLGYVIAPDAASAARLRSRQPRWSVNGLALALVPELLARTELDRWAAQIADLRSRFASELSALGYSVTTTAANWVLVEGPTLRSQLAPQRVVVRDCTSFGLPGTNRVALPRPREFDHVLDAFARVAHHT